MKPVIKFQVMADRSSELEIPSYKTAQAAGMDVQASESLCLQPGETRAVRTGLKVELEPGWELQVRSRSGLALKHSVHVLNAPGTIDADYRGEICAILHNDGSTPYDICVGDRIAQLVIAPSYQATVQIVDELSQTERGEGGFGSTGR